MTTANELFLPVGRTVQIHLKALDVIHSFWVPPLHGKVANPLSVNAIDARDRAGIVVVERRDLRQVARVREHDASEHAKARCRDEQRGDDRIAREPDDVMASQISWSVAGIRSPESVSG